MSQSIPSTPENPDIPSQPVELKGWVQGINAEREEIYDKIIE